MDQAYIRDDKKTIAQLVAETAKAVGDTLKVVTFARIELTAEEAPAE